MGTNMKQTYKNKIYTMFFDISKIDHMHAYIACMKPARKLGPMIDAVGLPTH
jgi:hypothetical protein